MGAFVWRELFPEYRIYQETYLELEALRGEEPNFKRGIKQILYETESPGPEQIDRCTTCHVTMTLPHFSPTRIARDINGKIRVDTEGTPIQEANPNYIFDLPGADALRYREVAGLPVDMARVLVMHPLMGAETRPFEYHPLEEYGCTSCHSGNGRSVNAKRAHGPVYDEEYEVFPGSPLSPYVEVDEENDPDFARVYNAKPGHDLLFHTEPLLPGALMEAKCAKCHTSGKGQIQQVLATADVISERKERQKERIYQGIIHDKRAIKAFGEMERDLETYGFETTHKAYMRKLEDPALTPFQRDAFEARVLFLNHYGNKSLARARYEQQQIDPSPKESAYEEAEQALRRLDNAKQPFTLIRDDKKLATEIGGAAVLTSYERGKELFVSQSCYACHRIDGMSRAGVGPDLTEIGNSYPWYVKMSIVWPQGKLPGSAMPNFRLDHEEVEDLMAFLMAQTGDTKALSEVQKETALKAWEAGKKLPWEEPIAPADIVDTRYAMHVFATQGCAACHKLAGFEGNVSFTGDDQEWFWRTFPQVLGGKRLIQILETKKEEINAKLVRNDKKDTILEELWEIVPSYYTAFKFAARAKADDEWKELVNRVLTMYIQEYGFGRDIAPRLSYSGIWRDDQWLTGHFLNPPAYTARSFMPIMPFDITKFYSLNNMLHVLGRKNQAQVHEVWKEEGFNPEYAYELFCSACHGTQKQGNGPIAEMLYPIPKNLRNAQFLRNLTREQAIQSVTHGVDGTPMPPWGEAIAGQTPMMSTQQIKQLVDWLFTSLPGGPVVADIKPEKWEYSPQDVARELGGEDPLIEKDGYYIKKEYYTPANIEAGQQLFLRLCAHCHGTEGAGNGERAETMIDAKPRILTNLFWLKSRDDLRLMRSIKYGVPGTSMTPLGDQTSAMQRLQIVTYIRTLSTEQAERQDLQDALYDSFDTAILAIESCRIGEYDKLEETEGAYLAAIKRREELYEAVQTSGGSPASAAAAYQTELRLLQTLNKRRALDKTLVTLIDLVRKERSYYEQIGEVMVAKDVDASLFASYLHWAQLRAVRYKAKEGCVEIVETADEKTEAETLFEEIVTSLDASIAALEEERELTAGRMRSEERAERLQLLTETQGGLINLKSRLLSLTSETDLLQEEQLKTFKAYQEAKS